MKFFKRDEQNLTASERANLENERQGASILRKLKLTGHLETGAWMAHTASTIYAVALLTSGGLHSTTPLYDAVVFGAWIGAWKAQKSVMKLFVRQLAAIDKTPKLSEPFQAALKKIREKSGYQPFTPRDKTALTWVGVAAMLGLAPPASYLYQVRLHHGETTETIGKITDHLKTRSTPTAKTSK